MMVKMILIKKIVKIRDIDFYEILNMSKQKALSK